MKKRRKFLSAEENITKKDKCFTNFVFIIFKDIFLKESTSFGITSIFFCTLSCHCIGNSIHVTQLLDFLSLLLSCLNFRGSNFPLIFPSCLNANILVKKMFLHFLLLISLKKSHSTNHIICSQNVIHLSVSSFQKNLDRFNLVSN